MPPFGALAPRRLPFSALEQDLSKAMKEHQQAQKELKELEEARKAGQSWSARCQGHEADSKMLLTAVQMLQLHTCKPAICSTIYALHPEAFMTPTTEQTPT